MNPSFPYPLTEEGIIFLDSLGIKIEEISWKECYE